MVTGYNLPNAERGRDQIRTDVTTLELSNEGSLANSVHVHYVLLLSVEDTFLRLKCLTGKPGVPES